MILRLILLFCVALSPITTVLHAADVERTWAELAGENLTGKEVELLLKDGREIVGKCEAVGARGIRIRLSEPPKDTQPFASDGVQAIRVFCTSRTARTLLTIGGAFGGMLITAAVVNPLREGDAGRRQIATIYGMGAAGGVAGYLVGRRIRKIDRTIRIAP